MQREYIKCKLMIIYLYIYVGIRTYDRYCKADSQKALGYLFAYGSIRRAKKFKSTLTYLMRLDMLSACF